MNQPYNIENLENQGKLIGDIDEPYFFKISAGQRYSKSLIYHAQIGTQYFMYRIHKNVNRESIQLTCKVPGCNATAQARIPKSSGLIKQTGTRSNGKRLNFVKLFCLLDIHRLNFKCVKNLKNL